jgi:NifB/MoaA-like Fe-S oxidoreductase
MLEDWRQLRQQLPATLPRPRHLTLACGTLAASLLQGIVDEMNGIGNLRVDLHVVRNKLFGDEVTCSGLLVGRDLLEALEGHELGDTLVLPRVMFDHDGQRTLDDVTLEEIQQTVSRPTTLVKRVGELREVLAA